MVQSKLNLNTKFLNSKFLNLIQMICKQFAFSNAIHEPVVISREAEKKLDAENLAQHPKNSVH